MPHQYKREPLNDDEVNKLTNACSEFADPKKDNIQWQERGIAIYLQELSFLF